MAIVDLTKSSFILFTVIVRETRLALASILGPFGIIHSIFRFYLGLLEFPVRICDALQSQNTRDVPNLSYEYDCDLTTGFPFVLVFTCTFI